MDPTRLNTYYNVGSSSDVMAYPRGASVYGAYDLAGNVAEWTADDLRPYEGSKAPPNFPSGGPGAAQTGSYKVLRGGSWKGDPFSTSLYHRNFDLPNHATDFYGFRCASDAEPAAREPT